MGIYVYVCVRVRRQRIDIEIAANYSNKCIDGFVVVRSGCSRCCVVLVTVLVVVAKDS